MLAIMSTSSTLIVFFRELRSASLETESASGISEYIRNNPDSALSQMVDEKAQREKLRYWSSRLLAAFARKKDLECDAGRLFAREMLAMQVFDLAATLCSTASYINWYIVETFKDVEDKGLLEKDSRIRDAEEAMAKAVAEAAEMTRLLEIERAAAPLQDDIDATPPLPPKDAPEVPPKTTFASVQPETPPSSSKQIDTLHQQPDTLLPSSNGIGALEGDMQSSSEPVVLPTTQSPSASSSPTSQQHDEPPQETLQGAKITLMDISTDAGTGKAIRHKSTLSYMITIEPPGGRVPGWVAIKQYPDFESLHEVLRRLANVGGIRSFPTELPEWKGRPHQSLTDDLENYLKSALVAKQLADSEAMKRFFGKEITDQSLAKKKAWPPLKGVGEGMRDAAEGSQKLLAAAWATTGISKKRSVTPVGKGKPHSDAAVKDEILIPDEEPVYPLPLFRDSTASIGSGSLGVDNAVERRSTSSSLNGYSFIGDGEASNSESTTSLVTPDRGRSRTPIEPTEISTTGTDSLPRPLSNTIIKPPSPIPPPLPERPTKSSTAKPPSPAPPPFSEQPMKPPTTKTPSPAPPPLPERPTKPSTIRLPSPELTANDAQQILDIGFSILSELYALSPRTWVIRKSLLNLLKSLLISNGRTYNETIRTMIQDDLINKCLTSDDWLASQVKAVTESMWPSTPYPLIDDNAYKIQAKELFLTKILPETMRGLMGGAATTQALEIVFEALQDQRVAKGVLVALMCDALRALQV